MLSNAVKPFRAALFALAATALLGVEREPLPDWVTSGNLPRGVTVIGSANVSAPATGVILTLGVTARDHVTPIGISDVTPLVDALVQAGVPRAGIALPSWVSDTSKVRLVPVTVTVEHPSLAAVNGGITILTRFLVRTPSLWVETAQATVRTDACTAIRAQAQQAAVDQALANAQRLAQYASLALGPAQAIDGRAAAADQNICSAVYAIEYPHMILSPSEYLSIRIASRVAMRFDLLPPTQD